MAHLTSLGISGAIFPSCGAQTVKSDSSDGDPVIGTGRAHGLPRSVLAPSVGTTRRCLVVSWKSSLFLLLSVVVVACGGRGSSTSGEGQGGRTATLTLAAYTTPREAYAEIIREFRRDYKARTGVEVTFRESYQASGAQARAVIGGFDADVVALSLEQDVEKVRAAGLITHDYRTVGQHGGMVTESLVVLAVRPGNPKGIRDWADLTRDGIEVLTPNVRTSGGAMWNVAAIWGATKRGHTPVAADAAEGFLRDVIKHVRIMDRSGRDSMITFERGVGDVAITYENEVLLGRSKGQRYEYVVPSSTIRIENPVALVDRNVQRHDNREVAEAFIAFLTTDVAQRIFARNGYRPVNQAVRTATAAQFPAGQDTFTVRDIGNWSGLDTALFAEGAAYDRAVAAAQAGR